MYVLGINGSSNSLYDDTFDVEEGAHHDAGAVLLHNGRIVAAYEEERLNRIKHTNKWPTMAINACLREHGLTVDQVDHFAFNISDKALNFLLNQYYGRQDQEAPPPQVFLQQLLENQFQQAVPLEKIELFEHHYAHAVTAFYPSQFDSAIVLTIDGSGGEYSGSVYEGRGNELKLLRTFSEEQSLGHFYSRITYALGFRIFDEYKVMGLAPYGNPNTYKKFFKDFYTLLPEGHFKLYNHRSDRVHQFSPPRTYTSGFKQEHLDIAAGAQATLEKVVFHIVKHFREVTGLRKLCIAGGVGLNGTLNGKLINSGLFEDVYVFPGANDSGLPVGGVLAAYYKHCKEPQRPSVHSLYLGTGIGENEVVLQQLKEWESFIHIEPVDDITRTAAELLAADKVIGWVQGRAEFAPRALGNRSILADARPAKNKERINSIVKKREGFRPFAPSVLEEYATTYFELPPHRTTFAHMIFVLNVQKKYRALLGAVTHVDGSARVQTVSKTENPKYWQLIDHFRQITGTPVVLNTSFNNNKEPIVDSVYDAVVSFLTTHLDYLVVGDFLVSKKDISLHQLAKLYLALPPYIKLRTAKTYGFRSWPHERTEYEFTNSYNKEAVAMPREIFEILIRADGLVRIENILQELQIHDTAEIEELLQQISRLWDRRMIMLSPFAAVNAAIAYDK